MPRFRLPYSCLGVLATAGLLLAGCGPATTPAPSSSTSVSPSAATPTASAPQSRSGPLTWHLPVLGFGPQSPGQMVLTGAARVTTAGSGGRRDQGTLRLHSSLPGAWPQIQETFVASGHGGTGTYAETMREPLSGALVRTTIHFTWRSSPAGGSLQGYASQRLLQKPPGAHVLLPGPHTTRLTYTRASGGILTFSLQSPGGMSIGPEKVRMAGTGRAQTVLYCGPSGCSRTQGYLTGLLPPAAPLALLLASNP